METKKAERIDYHNLSEILSDDQNEIDIDKKILYNLTPYILFDPQKNKLIGIEPELAEYLQAH